MEIERVVNEVVANYLKSYGGKYKLEDLKAKIISRGYTESEFNEALEVFKKEGSGKSELMLGKINLLPSQKFVGERKKEFGMLKFLLFLFGILIFSFSLIVLFNFLDMSFFGWNFFDYFK